MRGSHPAVKADSKDYGPGKDSHEIPLAWSPRSFSLSRQQSRKGRPLPQSQARAVQVGQIRFCSRIRQSGDSKSPYPASRSSKNSTPKNATVRSNSRRCRCASLSHRFRFPGSTHEISRIKAASSATSWSECPVRVLRRAMFLAEMAD